jgi:hypothetical protein
MRPEFERRGVGSGAQRIGVTHRHASFAARDRK